MGEYIVDNELESREHLYVDVLTEVNKKVLTPNALNKLSGDSVVILRNNVSIVEYAPSFSGNSEKHNAWYEVLNWINFLIIAIFVYLTVVFVKIMRLFIRSQLFEHKIISLLNHLGIAFLILAIITTAWNFGRTYLAGHLIDVEGLMVSYRHCIEWNNLLLGLVILVITEILRQATTIKEEQDLTI
jgi:ABC-type bacteriocin/lantibiotic exporter with double-glycine peptidase domain